MAEFTSHLPGSFTWIELVTPDIDGAQDFYRALFGWDIEDQLDADGNRTYAMARLDGKAVAGLGAIPPDVEAPSAWNSFVLSSDVDATAAAVEAAGGTVSMAPMDVSKSERVASFVDPIGAAFSAWKVGERVGVQFANVANTYSWNELLSRDVSAAQVFYNKVFGWEFEREQMPTGEYFIINDGAGARLGGMTEMPVGVPEETPNYWNVYFTVEDLDVSVEKVQQMGGQIVKPESILLATRRVITVADSWGARFTLLQPIDA